MANEMRVVKVSAEVFGRLVAIQKTLSEQAAMASRASPRMVLPTLGSVVELTVDAFEKQSKESR